METSWPGDTTGDPGPPSKAMASTHRRSDRARVYLSSVGVVALSSGVAWLMFGHVHLTNLAMAYLLGIVFVAIRFGRGPSILASALSLAVFDFCFVPPYLTLAVSDVSYHFTFLVMFVVALVISSLTVRVQKQAEDARLREQRTASLYRLTRELARATNVSGLASAAVRSVGNIFDGRVAILLPDRGTLQGLPPEANGYEIDEVELGVARWVFEHGAPAGLGTSTLPRARAMYLPLSTRSNTVGVLGILPADSQRIEDPEQRQLLGAFCKQTAVAIERTGLAEEARLAQARVEQEELRNTLLSSVSHDLRTPLAAIMGAASTLLEDDSVSSGVRREMLETIAEEAGRLNRLVGNLVDMTRLESGGLVVKKEWTPLEEIVGSALQRLHSAFENRPVRVTLPSDLPLVPMDGVLIEQVFVNLLENAAKYTPPGTPIEITARAEPDRVVVEVADSGPGILAGDEDRLFEKFFRGRNGSVGGTGLGLTISRGMLRAHGGDLRAENRAQGGALFRLTIPLDGKPPEIPREPREARPGADGSATR
jgi:two-component system, OmpR family, sensor histidine kinase KdpD